MATTDREPVKLSSPARTGNRSGAIQSLRRPGTLKSDVGASREPVRQSPPRTLNAK